MPQIVIPIPFSISNDVFAYLLQLMEFHPASMYPTLLFLRFSLAVFVKIYTKAGSGRQPCKSWSRAFGAILKWLIDYKRLDRFSTFGSINQRKKVHQSKSNGLGLKKFCTYSTPLSVPNLKCQF